MTEAASTKHYDVAIIGAGVAGLAAAVALARDGRSVVLLERRPFVGGRAYSYPHPALNETIDSQHVILGCCTNFIDLITQANASHTIRWYNELTFLEPNSCPTAKRCHPERAKRVEGPASSFSPDAHSYLPTASQLRSSFLPAPLHQSLSFLRAPMLSLRDKLGIALGLARFLRGYPPTDEESFATWLKRTGQTERAIRHFWEPVIVGALNDTFANCSTRYAGKVFHESFLRSPQAGRLGIPTAPLSDFFSPVAAHAVSLGVDLRLNTSADRIEQLPDQRWRITSTAVDLEADAVIVATDFRQASRLLASVTPPFAEALSNPQTGVGTSSHKPGSTFPGTAALSARTSTPTVDLAQFINAPITTIHLWYDREITSLDHAVLLDTRIQWLFHKSRIRNWPASQCSYLELVISASHAEMHLSRETILADALAELTLFFPKVREARLLKSAVLKEARATFSVTPGLDAHRPAQTTPYSNLYLAGDYTATDWPSTMESAVRSGRLAAALAAGHPRPHFLSPELPAAGLMRLLSRSHPKK